MSKEPKEKLIAVVTAYPSNNSIIIVIPSELSIKAGTKFAVKKDTKGRIIYEPSVEASS